MADINHKHNFQFAQLGLGKDGKALFICECGVFKNVELKPENEEITVEE